MGRLFFSAVVLLCTLALTPAGHGAESADPAATAEASETVKPIDPVALDREIQQMKSDVLTLGQDLAMLDSGILSMAGNPLVIYVSLDTDEGFELQAVDLTLEEQFVARLEFNDRSRAGMEAGGIRRLFVENLPAGKYRFKASLYGKVGKGRVHQSSSSFTVDKDDKARTLELQIVNFRQKYVPEFSIVEWE